MKPSCRRTEKYMRKRQRQLNVTPEELLDSEDIDMPSTRLPINIDELIKGRTVEGERLEFKRSKSQSKSGREPLNLRISRYLKTQDATVAEVSAHLEQKRVSGQLKIVLKEMIIQDLIEYSIPDKPRSRLQRYRLTGKGKEWLEGQR